eukprot:1944067-Ditylum_brightwellii.AAC.1
MVLRLVEMPSHRQKMAHWHQAVLLALMREAATPLRMRCWQRCHEVRVEEVEKVSVRKQPKGGCSGPQLC